MGPELSGFLVQFGNTAPVWAAALLSLISIMATIGLLPQDRPLSETPCIQHGLKPKPALAFDGVFVDEARNASVLVDRHSQRIDLRTKRRMRAHVVDVRDEFARGYIVRALKAGFLGGPEAATGSVLGRPLVAQKLVTIAHIEQAMAVAHGDSDGDATSFEVTVHSLDPSADRVSDPPVLHRKPFRAVVGLDGQDERPHPDPR